MLRPPKTDTKEEPGDEGSTCKSPDDGSMVAPSYA